MQYSSDTGSTLKCEELVSYNYAIRISIYVLLSFPSFHPVTVQVVIVPDCPRLPHIAVHCRILLYIVVHCRTLPYIAMHCRTLLYIAVYCHTLSYIAIHC